MMRIKKGDEVEIISGNEKGKRGKVRSVFPRDGKIVVEGVNIRKKHVRSRTAQKKGEIVSVPMPFFASRAMVVCSACNRGVRVRVKKEGDTKRRVCARCGNAI